MQSGKSRNTLKVRARVQSSFNLGVIALLCRENWFISHNGEVGVRWREKMTKEIEFFRVRIASRRRRQSSALVDFTLCGGARLKAAAISLTVQRLNRLSDASTAEVWYIETVQALRWKTETDWEIGCEAGGENDREREREGGGGR